MDKGIQKSQKAFEGNQCNWGTDHQGIWGKKAGRKPKEQEPGVNNVGDLISVLQHYFPKFIKWLKSLQDFRCPDRITFQGAIFVLEMILERLCGTDARAHLTQHRTESIFKQNLETLLGMKLERLPHGDTLAYYFEHLDQAELDRIRREMIHVLHKKKILGICKYQKHYLLAIDGVHLLTSKKPIPYSVKVKHSDGRVEYRQYVLEAKLVCPQGAVFSIGSVFIGDDDLTGNADGIKTDSDGKIIAFPKQDCELKAFKRLTAKIHQHFPKWKFMLLLDGLYMTKTAIDICRQFGWNFSITLKEGSAPNLYQAAVEKIEQDTHNRIRQKDGTTLKWCNSVSWENGGKKTYKLNVIGSDNGDSWSFLYATSIFIHKDNAEELQNEACRERWKIENQGFREQKHSGLALEKAFGTIGFAAQNFYLIVQITHIIRTLMIHSSLFRTIQRIDSHGTITETIKKPMLDFFGSIKYFVCAFARSIFSCRLTLRNDAFERLEFAVTS